MSSTQYTGLNGRIYRLSDHIKKGGEGAIYRLNGNADCVAKIYNNKKTAAEMSELEEKLKLMLGMNVDPYINGFLAIAWPKDLLYDSAGKFVGYVMPFVDGRKSLVVACRPTERADLLYGQDYTWKKSIATAYNFALLVDCLHRSGFVIGDFNLKNSLINGHAQATLIDVDSIQFRSSRTGKLYKCTVGLPEMMAPEIQGRDLRVPGNDFTVYTDRFSLALDIFMLLCNGFHPFNVIKASKGGNSTVGNQNTQTANITRGYCPFVKAHGKSELPKGAPDMAMLPDYIMELFRRAFDYDVSTAVLESTIQNRPTAAEWRDALERLFNECTGQCSRDPHHVYWSGYDRCPWCEMEGVKTLKRSAFPFFLICILVSMICSPFVLEWINLMFECGFTMMTMLKHGMIAGACSGFAIAWFLRKDYRKALRPGRMCWCSLIAPVYSMLYFVVMRLW